MVKPLMFLPVVAFAVLAGGLGWVVIHRDTAEVPSAFQDRSAPAVRLGALGPEAPFTDATLRDGTVKLVNFWASWCPPCREEHAELMSLQANGVPVYGVDWKDQPTKALDFLNDMGNPFTALGQDPKNEMGLDWGIAGVPETFVIDGDGKVLLHHSGPLTDDFIEDQIEPLLGGTSGNPGPDG